MTIIRQRPKLELKQRHVDAYISVFVWKGGLRETLRVANPRYGDYGGRHEVRMSGSALVNSSNPGQRHSLRVILDPWTRES